MKRPINILDRRRAAMRAALIAFGIAAAACTGGEPTWTAAPLGDFVEPDFPFIVSTVDARRVGSGFPHDNIATRGIVLQLGNDAYATFDPDLLRMAIGWHGDFMKLGTMAQVSYKEPLNKGNSVPTVLGSPIFATGIYPGWSAGDPDFTDPRPAGPNPEDAGRGPIPTDLGRWNGLYVVGDHVVLSYTVDGVDIHEQPSSVTSGGQVGIVRAFEVGAVSTPLTLTVAEVDSAHSASVEGAGALVYQGANDDTVTVVRVVDAPGGATLRVMDDRYVTLELGAGTPASLFRVVVWRGAASLRDSIAGMFEGPTEIADFEDGGPTRWPETVTTVGHVAPDTAAYVVDSLSLPVANPWGRNFRAADLDFFDDGRAAVVTFAGDVWIVSGLDDDLDDVEWKRFASGLYEPLSIQIVDGDIYVYSRGGIVLLQDLNGDGEADYYENFTDLIIQSTESREWALSMAEKPGGGFYVSKGGALDNGPRTSPAIMPGFRAGSSQAGTVMEISPDGRSLTTFATGLREPFIDVNPNSGLVTISDQQGNFVPATPIYFGEQGAYYGVVPTAHRQDLTPVPRPVVWLPHEVDQSGAGEVWVTGDEMGFGGDALVHLSYGRPGAFRVFVDSTADALQGAVVPLLEGFSAPLLKGQVNPRDGQLYLAGFQVWGSQAKEVSTISRVRYTGQESTLPTAVHSGEQGILIRFSTPLDSASATDAANYQVQRWNYVRSEEYGSGHYKLDGSPGEEQLPVAAAHLSDDGESVLLVIPDMREVMQMEVDYAIQTASDLPVTDTLYLTVNNAAEMDLNEARLADVDWRSEIASAGSLATGGAEAPASAARGEQIFQRSACAGCHSVDGSTAGKAGPTLLGLYGSTVTFADGSTRTADDAYIRESLLDPASQIVQGFEPGMPSFQGVLSDTEIHSLTLYLETLAAP